MRSEQEIITLILNIAKNDERIRAVLLNGSRANPNVKKDRLQDFDIVYIVTEIKTFLNDHDWINIFGERLILQMPKEMVIGEKSDDSSFQYLMLFKDGNRIDLTLFPFDKIESEFNKDSLTILLLDKDNIFGELSPPTDKNYLIKPPTEKEFIDCCNEFWWVSTYVAKGLWRSEIIYAKQVLEVNVRAMFLKIIEWYIGTKTGFTVSFGKDGRNMRDLISTDLYEKILSTYPDSNTENTWNSLFRMTELFHDLAKKIANRMNFNYNENEAYNVTGYLKWAHDIHTQKN
jgi:aminoglycoside 6-adenylyltransferase